MSDREKSFGEPIVANGPEVVLLGKTELPIQYTLPFDWGAMRVTEAAHQAYSFTPLREGVQRGDASLSADTSPISVRLIAPDEIPESLRNEHGGLFLASLYHKKGVDIQAGFNHDRDGLDVESAAAMLQQALGIEDESLEATMDAFEDSTSHLPAELARQQQVSQLMVHVLSETLPIAVTQAYGDMRWQHEDRKTLNKLAVIGGVTVLLAGGTVLFYGDMGAPVEITSAVTTIDVAIGLWGVREIIKTHLGNTFARERRIAAETKEMAQAVSDDLHATYCVAHFDDENQQRLED